MDMLKKMKLTSSWQKSNIYLGEGCVGISHFLKFLLLAIFLSSGRVVADGIIQRPSGLKDWSIETQAPVFPVSNVFQEIKKATEKYFNDKGCLKGGPVKLKPILSPPSTPPVDDERYYFLYEWECPVVGGTQGAVEAYGFAAACPANSLAGSSGSDCVCSSGYTARYDKCVPDFMPDPKNNGPTCDYGPTTPNPISIATGNKWLVEHDYKEGNGSFIKLARYYNSNGAIAGGVFGRRWSSVLDARIELFNFDGKERAVVYRPDGKAVEYVSNGRLFTATIDVNERLSRAVDASGQTLGWKYVDLSKNTIESYDEQGRLLSILSAAGLGFNVEYVNGRISSVVDSGGRRMVVTFNSQGRVSKIVLPGGEEITYAYDAAANLVEVEHQDKTLKTYHYDERDFISSLNMSSLLTGVTDESRVRRASYGYDALERATREYLVGGVAGHQLTFQANQVAVQDPLGSTRTYSFQTIYGARRLSGQSQPGGAGCDPASSALGYDTNGNIKSRTDFNGVTTSYVYDLSRNLETSRTEAVGTPQARTISTIWHPTFRLPATLTEPGRVTEFTYDNTKGLLTQKKVTADGVSRIESWSYFPNGLVQTATDARGKVTSYTYDAQANLATLTDPAGLQTRFTQYDAHGNVLTQIAPNGVTTTFTYDLRQRLKTRTTGGEQTRFDYKPTGLLEKVTFPDQSWLQYRYDPAQRLIGIDHSNGSHVDYSVIDNAGNIKQEDRYDPAGVLAAAQQAATQAQSLPSAPKAQ
ncbi:MAG TPA: DUF6531 domain-containing protein [Chitinolyticbacter sp.]|nr:DUF6531 domain-containing protein [Chitinolyticbacter sp.]